MGRICATCLEFIPDGQLHACSGQQIPALKSVRQVQVQPATESRGRIEIRLQVDFSSPRVPPEMMLMHTTYKKHLVESYQTNEEYTPQAAPQNTMCRVSLAEFTASFDKFGRYFADQLKARGTSIAPNMLTFDAGNGVFFTSDKTIAGMDIHCFPCLPATAQSRVTFQLNTQQFADMVKILRFMYHAGDRLYREDGQQSAALSDLTSKHGDARVAYGRQSNAAWFLGIFTEMERATIAMKLKVQPTAHAENKKTVGAMLNRPKFKAPT